MMLHENPGHGDDTSTDIAVALRPAEVGMARDHDDGAGDAGNDQFSALRADDGLPAARNVRHS